jgi:hypothetical protein
MPPAGARPGGRAASGRAAGGRAVSGRAAGGRAAADGEQLQGVGQFGQVADAVHAMGAAERLPAAVGGGQRAGVRGHHGPAPGRAADGQQHDREVAVRGPGQDGAQAVGVAHRFQDEGEHPGLGQVQRVLQVGRGGGDEFLAGGHG